MHDMKWVMDKHGKSSVMCSFNSINQEFAGPLQFGRYVEKCF